MSVTGRTLIYPLIGHPVAQVRTPPAINAWFRERDIDAVMFAADVDPEAVSLFLSNLRQWYNCGGCSVTVPHKQAAFRSMDSLSERARRVGAVNIVRRMPDGRLSGDMTDGLAFVEALRRNGVAVAGTSVLLAGAGGGAGAAIADALCAAGARGICLQEPHAARKASIERLLSATYPEVGLSDEPAAEAGFDIAVNASALGMRAEDPLPFDPGLVRPGGVVADVVTKPETTALLTEAAANGYAIQGGNDMADAQLEFQMRHLGLWPRGEDSDKAA